MNSLKNNCFKNIKLKNVKRIYNEFNIDPVLSFQEQKWYFKEDLIQIEFNNKYLIDIGWYPELNPDGFFLISVIKNYDWDNPSFEKKCKDIETLKKYLQEAVDFVNATMS